MFVFQNKNPTSHASPSQATVSAVHTFSFSTPSLVATSEKSNQD